MKKFLQNISMLLAAFLLVGGVAKAETTVVKSWPFKTLTWSNTEISTTTTTINNVACNNCTGALEGLALQSASWIVNGNGLMQGNGDRNIAILDLKANDIVTIETATTLSSIVNGTGETLTGTCVFTVTEDGVFGFKTTRNAYISSITVEREIVEGVCESPIASIAAAGTSRVVTLTCETPASTIYYSETNLSVDDEGWEEYSSPVTTSAPTLYAYAATSTAKSEVVEITTGAGSEIKLNAPVITKTAYNNGVYTVSFSSTQTGLEIIPTTVTYAYSIDGGASQIGTEANVAENSNISVVTQATGYANSDAVTLTPKARPTSVKEAWSQDFKSLVSSADGTGPVTIVYSDAASFEYNERSFYKILGYNNTSGEQSVTVNDNFGIINASNIMLRNNGNNSGILNNANNAAFIGINNLNVGDIIVVGVNSVVPYADAGVTLNDGMSTTTEYYFTATDTKASIGIPKGTYNYVQNVQVLTATNVTITLPANTYGTYTPSVSVDFTGNEDVEAYSAVLNAEGTAVMLTPVTAVPAGEGVVLKKISESATTTVNIVAEAATLSGNQLVGVTVATAAADLAAGTNYILVGDEFHMVEAGATGTIAAGKAYLNVPAAAAARVLTIAFGDATAAEAVVAEANAGETVIYNLAGVRIKQPVKGNVYIVNGKTVRF